MLIANCLRLVAVLTARPDCVKRILKNAGAGGVARLSVIRKIL
jgi:hypothetical protein